MSKIAIIRTGSKQYLVKEGDVIRVEKLAGDVGSKVSLETLFRADADKAESVEAGALGTAIQAEVLEHGMGKKIEVVKYKAKSRYTRRTGHRQAFTKLRIQSI